MPIYCYECCDCEKEIEKIVGPSDNELDFICDGCGGQLARVISLNARPQFKGSGFYENDYKRKT